MCWLKQDVGPSACSCSSFRISNINYAKVNSEWIPRISEYIWGSILSNTWWMMCRLKGHDTVKWNWKHISNCCDTLHITMHAAGFLHMYSMRPKYVMEMDCSALFGWEFAHCKYLDWAVAAKGNNISSFRDVRDISTVNHNHFWNSDEFIGNVIACCCFTCNGAVCTFSSFKRKC